MRLGDLAAVIRSKNAGIYYVTVDVMFDDRETFEAVRESGAVTRGAIAERLAVPVEELRLFWYEPGMAVKATYPRAVPAGSFRDADLYGAQQHAPLYRLEVELD